MFARKKQKAPDQQEAAAASPTKASAAGRREQSLPNELLAAGTRVGESPNSSRFKLHLGKVAASLCLAAYVSGRPSTSAVRLQARDLRDASRSSVTGGPLAESCSNFAGPKAMEAAIAEGS
ncbi:hypothetical protein S40293_10475 [Stachybotrys chartarum IBT 40293]|nr:hypothetical protein S40293_10475 [Stachybotrys chartarum IBT 40293]KFA71392.1 hypothetical protein S40288_11481 [Stachybotrys chartarum IBT 40288]